MTGITRPDDPIWLLAQLALISFPFLLGIIAWFVQRLINDVKSHFVEDKAAHDTTVQTAQNLVTKETSARLVALEGVRNEVETLQKMVLDLQREVDKDYINFTRLNATLHPLQTAIENLSRDLREGQRELFNRLDGKMDKQ